jgi:hypothetical protein
MDLDDRAAAFRFPSATAPDSSPPPPSKFTTSSIERWPRRCASVRFWHAGATNPWQQEGVMADPDEWDQESGQHGAEDTLDDRGVTDPLDEGVSPPERAWVGDGWGVTAREEAQGESLDGRLVREQPDGRPDDGDGLGDTTDTDGECGTTRSARCGAGVWWRLTRATSPTGTASCGRPMPASTARPPLQRRPPCTSSPSAGPTMTANSPAVGRAGCR